MIAFTPEQVRRVVQAVLEELARKNQPPAGPKAPRPASGPRALIVFNAGLGKLDQALEQARLIEGVCAKSSVYTAEAIRGSLCGDVKAKTGGRCRLDIVDRDGLELVRKKSDVLVLPTFCLGAAARVANLLTAGDLESGLLLSALLEGQKVLAADDGFLILDRMSNPAVRAEMDRLLDKLRGFGVVLCPTERLFETFREMTSGRPAGPAAETSPGRSKEPALRLVTANDVMAAVNEHRTEICLARGGLVTPLARDLAREYSIQIRRRETDDRA
ncbi:MAG: hypothetical protein AB1641_13085 [Thermodesulfobacteriota bacterium]